MKKERNELVEFFVGIIMLVAGLYWFTSSVEVIPGFGTFRIWGFSTGGGFIIIPLIVGVCWLFFNPSSFGAKIVMVLGVVVIIASVIANTRFIFQRRNLYEYILMLIFICGGAALTARVLFIKPKDSAVFSKDEKAKIKDYDRLKNELDDLKKKMR